ncbi:hypothetical protein GKO48_12405 [Candidatus Lucifugimonas marina]|uniref:Deoxyribodipyrimidine photo-lyase n=4 Tax=Candidatus Lucifugimonas marina TaxID=3038979 RepID=A0AAJ5ZG45_9CHLR|nr:hypothetical protein GKO48_12405 [SAR202 cluster bacterium JH1073]
MSRYPISIWWVRSDLRLEDNPALSEATIESEVVIPVFVFDLKSEMPKSKLRSNFLNGALNDLDSRLREIGSRLLIKQGDTAQELAKIIDGESTIPVFANAGYSRHSKFVESQVARHTQLRLFSGQVTIDPSGVSKENGEPFKVYSAFRRKWEQVYQKKIFRTDYQSLGIKPEIMSSCDLHSGKNSLARSSTRANALRTLRKFTGLKGGINRYSELSDRVDQNTTSGMSEFISLGLIGPNELFEVADYLRYSSDDNRYLGSVNSWRNQLIWREFFKHSLDHFPDSENQSLNPNLESIDWINQKVDIDAWNDGETGYPIVDAAMRQLSEDGWIHNRLRMIVASFLVKDLLVDWRIGANWFHDKLVDYDSALNSGNWQWVAGTGFDASPFFRVFNPVLQGRKFDPKGNYVRRWIPEIKKLPSTVIHSPWELPRPPKNYPSPIIDHSWARKRVLSVYADAKSS